ncbi:protein DEK isoform X2 [Cynoglossus semilaevis]|uniref:protein DEK isoform X2 n=1 Tax=Cynoglossus semilaevis TaxID=244447 RepID=UPI0007DC88A3|nr:protein DEK isoform X2 [Cynoglossus semilaevis]
MSEEVMDSSAVSEEEVDDQQEASQNDQSSPDKSPTKTAVVGEIVDGKRAKKKVERLDFQAPKQKEKLKFGDGSGDKLGDIPRTNFQITKMKPADLKPLHTILFDRPGKMASIKKNLRLFNGFPFSADSEQYNKKREKLLKNSHFTNSKLKVVCGVLDLEKKGTHSDLVDRIMTYLIAPKNSGKRVPVKKRKSKKKLSGDDTKTKTQKKKTSKPKNSSSSPSPKKSKAGSKSKAIVMDSSSDEDDEEEKKVGESVEAEASDPEEQESGKEEEEEEEEEENSESEEEQEEEEAPKSKPARGKSAPKKRQRSPTKKSTPPKKRARKVVSEESESEEESEEDSEEVSEKPQKKKPAPVKPAAKTKKADSSSNSKNSNAALDDSSDDDEPLIKMIKKEPSDEQLKETVKNLLKDANLEEMTMKQICQRVFDNFPDHDLTNRKDFIKQTVKTLIT